jgi:hypothetical protein
MPNSLGEDVKYRRKCQNIGASYGKTPVATSSLPDRFRSVLAVPVRLYAPRRFVRHHRTLLEAAKRAGAWPCLTGKQIDVKVKFSFLTIRRYRLNSRHVLGRLQLCATSNKRPSDYAMFGPKLSTRNGRKKASEIWKATSGARGAPSSALDSYRRDGAEIFMAHFSQVGFAEVHRRADRILVAFGIVFGVLATMTSL